jgi:cell division protein DivIC
MNSIKFLNNRYLYSTLTLLVFLFIIEDTSVFKLFQMKKELNNIVEENKRKGIEIEQVKLKTIQLTTDKNALEKFAREHYLMKKKNEVIYIFNDL